MKHHFCISRHSNISGHPHPSFQKKRLFRRLLSILFFCAAASCLLFLYRSVQSSLMQKRLSREVLRFHILANSDSHEDQTIKLLIRDRLLNWLDQTLTDSEKNNRNLMENRLSAMLPEIEALSDKLLDNAGISYQAHASISTCYFPNRTYGECRFPAGSYRALRISLGNADGHNWWCVLFPSLCFRDSVHAVLPEDSLQYLSNTLSAEDYEVLFDPDQDDFHLALRFF